MGHFVDLSTAIVNVLSELQQSGAAAFADIEESPTLFFSGYPAVNVIPSDNTSDYQTIVSNFRIYGFYVDIFVQITDPNSTQGYSKAFTTMRTLADTALDAFDNSNTLNDACQILRPAASAWSVVETEASVMLTARITLRCGVSVVTNNG